MKSLKKVPAKVSLSSSFSQPASNRPVIGDVIRRSMGLGDIKESLKYLGLAQSRCLYVKELKAKLRKLQKAHHPDKNVDKDETIFKKVMEEAEKVLLFIKDHPEWQSEEEDPADVHLLKLLGAGGEIHANKGSYTIILSSAWGNLEELVAATEMTLKTKRSGEEKAWRVASPSSSTDLDSLGVTVSFWHEPKSDKRSKMLIQGKSYDGFLLFVLPGILKAASDKMGSNPLALGAEERRKPEGEGGVDIVSALRSLQQGFHQVELAVRDLDTRLVKVEEKVQEVNVAVSPSESSKAGWAEVVKNVSSLNEKLEVVKNMSGEVKKAVSEIDTSEKNITVLSEINSGIKELVKASKASLSMSGTAKSGIVEVEEEENAKTAFVATSLVKKADEQQLSESLRLTSVRTTVDGVEEIEEGGSKLEDALSKIGEEVEVIIIQCGDLDVTRAKTGANANLVREAGEKLVALAASKAENQKCDIFLSQLTPRYDDAEAGKGDLAKLTEVFNNQVRASAMFLTKVHTIPQSRLASTGKQIEARFEKDGRSLSEAGASIWSKNVVEAISKVRKDLLKESEEPKTPVKTSTSEKQGGNPAGPSFKGGGGRGRGYEERGRGRGFEEPARRGAALPNRWRGGPSNWGDHQGGPWDQNHHGNWGPYQ